MEVTPGRRRRELDPKAALQHSQEKKPLKVVVTFIKEEHLDDETCWWNQPEEADPHHVLRCQYEDWLWDRNHAPGDTLFDSDGEDVRLSAAQREKLTKRFVPGASTSNYDVASDSDDSESEGEGEEEEDDE